MYLEVSVEGFYVSKDKIIYDFIILFLLLYNLAKTRFLNLETIINVRAIQIKAWRHIPQPARVYAWSESLNTSLSDAL